MTLNRSKKYDNEKENHSHKLKNYVNKIKSTSLLKCKCSYYLNDLHLIYHKHMELCPIICVHG